MLRDWRQTMARPFEPFINYLKLKKRKPAYVALVNWVLCELYEKTLACNIKGWRELYKLEIYCITEQRLIQGKEISGMLREYLIKEQKNRCCYCKRFLFNIAYARPVDHILPVKHYPQFSLILDNLVVACYDCNQAKHDYNWWPALGRCNTYPTESQLTGAFHGKYHAYDGHIKWFRYSTNNMTFCAYAGLTTEGRKLCVDLLHDVVKKEILLIRDDGLKEALEVINQHNAIDHPLPELENFMQALHKKILFSKC